MDKYKVFIIDDQVENLRTMVDIFEQYRPEYEIFQTNNPENVIHITQRVKPDLIVTDWDMPNLNGIEVIQNLKKKKETMEIPVIMATGIHITSNDLQVALEVGAVDFVRKPIDPIELVARTHSALLISKYHKETLALKDHELTESSLHLIKSNKFNIDITKKLHELKVLIQQKPEVSENLLKTIISDLNSRIQEDSWHRFNLSFTNVHKDFTKNLVDQFPDLTGMELKLCAFIRLGMNNKDIAALLNQNPDSIKVSRSRLRKKLGLDQSQNLESFLNSF
ncbi:MAG: response regulator [Salinivirgaceae bacterium]|nr:response regulator [Salinivirgaceae bacterium]